MEWPSISRVSFMNRCGQARRVTMPYRKGMRVRMLNMRRSMALTWSMGVTLSSRGLDCQNGKWLRFCARSTSLGQARAFDGGALELFGMVWRVRETDWHMASFCEFCVGGGKANRQDAKDAK